MLQLELNGEKCHHVAMLLVERRQDKAECSDFVSKWEDEVTTVERAQITSINYQICVQTGYNIPR